MLVTAEQLFNTALEISGYNTNDIFETSNIGERLLSIVNTIYSDLYYFNVISPTAYNIIKIIVLLITLFINGFLLGKNSQKKGYLEGIKLSIPLVLLFFIITLINKSFTLKILLYYIIIILTTSFGSMIGINKKKNCN